MEGGKREEAVGGGREDQRIEGEGRERRSDGGWGEGREDRDAVEGREGGVRSESNREVVQIIIIHCSMLRCTDIMGGTSLKDSEYPL